MTVKDVVDRWASMPDDQAESYRLGLIHMFTPSGKLLLKWWEQRWFEEHSKKPYATFLLAQQARVKGILTMFEMSEQGRHYRLKEVPGTKQLTWETPVYPHKRKRTPFK